MKLNPEVIEEIAAKVFWTYAFENGVNETLMLVAEGVPPLMWSLEKAEKEIVNFGVPKVENVDPQIVVEHLTKVFYEEVLEHILRHVREERNIIGPIYVDDFKDCKEPDFKFAYLLKELTIDSDENCDYNIVTQGDFKQVGTLLIRTPLPSGILLREDPSLNEGVIMVKDTKSALGFHKTLIFAPDRLTSLPPNPQRYEYFLSGLFYLPTSRSISHTWYKLIPNTSGVCESAMFVQPNGNTLSFSIRNKSEVEC